MTKNAIVFGATSGIGLELSKLLVNDGYHVLITGRRKERLLDLEKSKPGSYVARQHDITDVKDSQKLFEALPSIFSNIDLIVHNAGIGTPNYELEWDKDIPTINTNVVGATMIYQLSYNYFKKQGHGHLVSITSMASMIGNRHVPAYHASKSYQSSYMESLWMKAKRTKKANISITNILPGYVDTAIVQGETFWMAPLDKATKQIYGAIKKKKRIAYITKRWRLIAFMMWILPTELIAKIT